MRNWSLRQRRLNRSIGPKRKSIPNSRNAPLLAVDFEPMEERPGYLRMVKRCKPELHTINDRIKDGLPPGRRRCVCGAFHVWKIAG